MMFHFKRFSSRSKIFSSITLAVLCLVVLLADSIMSNLSLHPISNGNSDTNQPLELQSHHSMRHPLKSTSLEETYREIRGGGDGVDDDGGNFVPPFNLTDQERIALFKKKLPEIVIFKSNPLTARFDNRVQEFFKDDCKVQFFMTWISSARSFRWREFLALESLFKSNPHGCLVILSKTMDSLRGQRILKPLLDSGFRVLAITPDLPFLFRGTPAESWFEDIKNGTHDPGEIPLAQNLSNLMRLAALYKYGGVYLDMDVIVLKDFSNFRNSIGAQSVDFSGNWTRLNNAVLVFDKNHPILYKFIEEFSLTFDGNKWGHNGPYLVSRVVERITNQPDLNLTVLPPMAFYPADWTRISGFFAHPTNQVHSKWIEAKLLQLSGQAYAVHLWNKESSRLRIEEGSIIGRLITEHCVICKPVGSY